MLDVWKEKQAESVLQIAVLKDQLKKLEWQNQQLIDAFLFRREIDQAIFDDQMAKLKEERTLAEMELHQLRLEELEVEALLSFSQHLLLNAVRRWVEASSDQKQRLQEVLFPEGLSLLKGILEPRKPHRFSSS